MYKDVQEESSRKSQRKALITEWERKAATPERRFWLIFWQYSLIASLIFFFDPVLRSSWRWWQSWKDGDLLHPKWTKGLPDNKQNNKTKKPPQPKAQTKRKQQNSGSLTMGEPVKQIALSEYTQLSVLLLRQVPLYSQNCSPQLKNRTHSRTAKTCKIQWEGIRTWTGSPALYK